MIKLSARPNASSKVVFLLFSSLTCLLLLSLSFDFSPAEAQLSDRTIYCNPSNGSGGLAPGTYSDTTIAGQPAVVIVSENYDPATPTLLTFYLHGDGGGYQFYSQDGRPLNKLVRDNGWIFVAPQAPALGESFPWYSDGVSTSSAGNVGIEANAKLFENVIEDMFSKYNLCENILLGHSASGGSWFYDGYFVPTRGDKYPAFMNIQCGSSGINAEGFWPLTPFYSNLNIFKDDSAIQNRTQMHYTIGDGDFLYDEAEKAIPHYKGIGFNVTTDILPGVGHCAFDLPAKTIAYWTAVNNSITISNTPVTPTPVTPTPVTPTPVTPTPVTPTPVTPTPVTPTPVTPTANTRTIECNPSNGSGGLAAGVYETMVAGRPALVVVGENYNSANPTKLGFYLHGDEGGYNFFAQEGSDLNKLIDDQGWIYMALLANDDTNDGNRWGGIGLGGAEADAIIEANGQLLENAFEEMFSKYNICKNVLLGHSVSGGSWFYDGYFLPTRGDRYPAFMNIGCGSSGIDEEWRFFPLYDNLIKFKSDSAIQNRTQLHYTIGTEDFLFLPAERAIAHYKSLGFDVTTDILADVAHCAFDQSEKTTAYWTAVNNSITISNTLVLTPTPFPPGFLDEFVYLPLLVK